MKKALAGPAKRSAKRMPERGAMIAATRRRVMVARVRAQTFTRRVDRSLNRLLIGVSDGSWSRSVDRRLNRLLLRGWPWVVRVGRPVQRRAARGARWAERRARPVGVALFKGLSALERRLLRARDLAIRGATRASAALSPPRAIAAATSGVSACLIASQFVDYRGVEVGQPGYAGLDAATPPTLGIETAGSAHAFLLIPLALLAAALATLAARRDRPKLGRLVFGVGLLCLAVVLLVDLPAGLDEGAQASRFSGATAVLLGGFYAELAAAAGLMLCGALIVAAPAAASRYHARPCRIRTSLFARAASGLRRRLRRRASSRGRAARRGSRRRSGAVSAPASRP